jgi:hypothetical protein
MGLPACAVNRARSVLDVASLRRRIRGRGPRPVCIDCVGCCLCGTWRSSVAHLNGVQGVAGSNPAVPISKGSRLMPAPFLPIGTTYLPSARRARAFGQIPPRAYLPSARRARAFGQIPPRAYLPSARCARAFGQNPPNPAADDEFSCRGRSARGPRSPSGSGRRSIHRGDRECRES